MASWDDLYDRLLKKKWMLMCPGEFAMVERLIMECRAEWVSGPDRQGRRRARALKPFYIDPVNGSDDNDGKSRETPLKTWRRFIQIVQPTSYCDGSRQYAYDAKKEDGRGARLAGKCPGCRACQ